MPILWRISNYENLEGIGGLYSEGRWHRRGLKVVYLAEHPALALLEVMVHLEIDHEDLPDSYKMLKIRVPEHDDYVSECSLPENWKHDENTTQAIGVKWLEHASSPLLRVPSVILPESINFILNPMHPSSADITIVDVIDFPFDERLKF